MPFSMKRWIGYEFTYTYIYIYIYICTLAVATGIIMIEFSAHTYDDVDQKGAATG